MPSGAVYQSLKEVIHNLSKEYGTVNFEPHVTIIGRLTGDETVLIEKTKELAESMGQFKISLEKLQQSDEYFKCIFLECERSRELIDLNQKARELFGRLEDEEFQPHLSLLYDKLGPKTREQALESLKLRFEPNMNFVASNIRFMLTAQHPAIELKKFDFQRLNK